MLQLQKKIPIRTHYLLLDREASVLPWGQNHKNHSFSRIVADRQDQRSNGEDRVDVMLVSDQSTSFIPAAATVTPTHTPQFTFLALDDALPFMALREMDASGVGYISIIPASRTFGYPEHYVRAEKPNEMDFMFDLMRKRAGTESALVWRWTSYYSAPRYWDRLGAGPRCGPARRDLRGN